MIRLRGVACLLPGPDRPPRLAFGPVDLDIPADRILAILGEPAEARTALLRLLAGRVRPDAGTISIAPGASPVINDERLLHPALTGLANLRFLARTYGVVERDLIGAVDAFCGLGPLLSAPVRTLDGGARRTLEAAAVAVLPFNPILLDDAQQLPAPVLARILASARARGSGLIFATAAARAARQHADAALILRGARLLHHPDPHDAAAQFERQPA